METKTIHNIVVVVLLIIGGMIPIFLFWSGTVDRLLLKYHESRMTKLRKNALKYIGLLHKTMIDQHYTRHQRRQFWREFVVKGRFEA